MAESKRKFMKIEAYEIISYDCNDVERKNGKRFDFHEFDKVFQRKKVANSTKLDVGLSTHELNSITKKDSFYELVFSKLESTDYPIVFNDNGEMTDMKDNISEDKRIGYITCGVYDDVYKVLLLQINFNAMNVRHIENYLNELFIKEGKEIKLIPLIDDNAFKRAITGYKTKVDVSMQVKNANIKETNKSTIFYRRYKEAVEMNAVNTKFTFSMGRVRKDTLEDKIVNDLLEDIKENINIIGKAEVSYKEQLDAKVSVADLVLQKLNTKVYFDIPDRATLREESIISKIKENYNDEFSGKLKKFYSKMIK
ncbi:DUF6731 family protein [Mammaliicoccus sciuri]|uniref:DUF6731 family protein n=1 Tax=Mammaliicoccus sciuri TaxID=1296 RepID=UPI001E4C8757|nr:DUF6731 family protein [Mammaliicoccus sciuri]MCD8824880.1 hypothetical protein [Mammaliicoccus sciuri]